MQTYLSRVQSHGVEAAFDSLLAETGRLQDIERVASDLTIAANESLTAVPAKNLISYILSSVTDQPQLIKCVIKQSETYGCDEFWYELAGNPAITSDSLSELYERFLHKCLLNPRLIRSGVQTEELCQESDFMIIATAAWDNKRLSGGDFAIALRNTIESALPRDILDVLFERFTDPENLNPPWEEALALISNSRLRFTRNQMVKLLESPDPELYVTALERDPNEDVLTWQDWQRLGSTQQTDIKDQISDAIHDLFDSANDIQRRVSHTLLTQRPERLFSDTELLFWFVTSQDEKTQQCAAHIIENMDFDTSRFHPKGSVDNANIDDAMWKILQYMSFSPRHLGSSVA